ncbi:MAG: phospholipase, partial [Alphaproteobacteria bacterium]
MTSGPEDEEISPLDRPEAVWRRVGADRAAVVTDGGPYFALIREALLKARHSVLIAGWDIHSDTRLLPHDPEDGAPIELGPLLTHIARRNPELKIRLLVWDYSVMYAAEREILPSFQIGWRTPANVDFRLDDRLPVGASHHQKIVVID